MSSEYSVLPRVGNSCFKDTYASLIGSKSEYIVALFKTMLIMIYMDKNTKNMFKLYPKNVSKSCFKCKRHVCFLQVYWAQKILALPDDMYKPVFKFITCLIIMFVIIDLRK
jgi:hypothetical protein